MHTAYLIAVYDPTLYFDAETIELNREAFGLFDKDSSGEIDVKELKRVLKALGHDLKKKQVQVQAKSFSYLISKQKKRIG